MAQTKKTHDSIKVSNLFLDLKFLFKKMFMSHGLDADFLQSTSYIHAPDSLDGHDIASEESGTEQIW